MLHYLCPLRADAFVREQCPIRDIASVRDVELLCAGAMRNRCSSATGSPDPTAAMSCRAGGGAQPARTTPGGCLDADGDISLPAAARWEEPGPLTRPVFREVSTGGSPEVTLPRALDKLQEFDLWYPGQPDRAMQNR